MGTKESKTSNERRFSDEDYECFKAQTCLSEYQIQNISEEFYSENPSGYLDKEHFFKLYMKLTKENSEQMKTLAEKIFKSFDKNGDGRLDFTEFMVFYEYIYLD